MKKIWLSSMGVASSKEEVMLDKAFLEPMSENTQTPWIRSKFL
jgi:hypothetical protein